MNNLKNKTGVTLALRCGPGGRQIALGPGKQVGVSLEYLHGEECIDLLNKRWVSLEYDWMPVLKKTAEVKIEERPSSKTKKKSVSEKKANAVQKSSAEKVDVRKQARDGKEVGKRNSKKQEAAKETE